MKKYFLEFCLLFAICPTLIGADYDFRVFTTPLEFTVQSAAYTNHQKAKRLGAIGANLKTGVDYNSVAADWSFLPVGSVFKIKGNGPTNYVVDDHLPSVEGKAHVEIYVDSEEQKTQWNTRQIEIEVYRVGDFRKSYNLLRSRAATEPHCLAMAQRIYQRFQAKASEFGRWVIPNTNAVKEEDLPKSLSEENTGKLPEENMRALFP